MEVKSRVYSKVRRELKKGQREWSAVGKRKDSDAMIMMLEEKEWMRSKASWLEQYETSCTEYCLCCFGGQGRREVFGP